MCPQCFAVYFKQKSAIAGIKLCYLDLVIIILVDPTTATATTRNLIEINPSVDADTLASDVMSLLGTQERYYSSNIFNLGNLLRG